MAIVIQGKELAKRKREELKNKISDSVSKGKRPPHLVSVMVGKDGGSLAYIKGQKKVSEEVGINYEVISFNEDISQDDLVCEIGKLRDDSMVDGIIIQLPLPDKYDESAVVEAIGTAKDVDGLTYMNLGLFYSGSDAFVPCTARAVLEILKSCDISLIGKKAVVLGRSNIVGKPVAALLISENLTVTVAHSKTQNAELLCREADVLVSAMGRPESIDEKYIKPGAIVIDVGTTMVEGRLKGDINFEKVSKVASYITPVPGGVGAMTTTMLMENTYGAWIKNVQ